MATQPSPRVRSLLDRYGRTYAEEAGIQLADRPMPLYQLLVLATLLAKPIGAQLAVGGARELFAAGYRSTKTMRAAPWLDRVAALGRGRYRRFDESTATILGKAAAFCDEHWHGDLRMMRAQAEGNVVCLRAALMRIPGIGPAGADIFVREVQGIWPEFGPFIDAKAMAGARAVGLPDTVETIAALTSAAELPRLASALVRAASAHTPDLEQGVDR